MYKRRFGNCFGSLIVKLKLSQRTRRDEEMGGEMRRIKKWMKKCGIK